MIRGKHCPNCGGDLVIWHITFYRTFKPEDLTPEKMQEFKQWFEEVCRPKIDEVWETIGETGKDPIICPHCEAKLGYVNNPVVRVKVVSQ